MKKHLSIVLILFVSLICRISYAYDDPNPEEQEFMLNEVDTPPVAIKVLPPNYPSKKSFEGILLYAEGRVYVKFVVTKDGGVRSPEIVKAVPKGMFEESALEAVKKYRFKPATKNGKPVDCSVILPIKFSMPGVETSFDAYEATQKGHKYIKTGEYDKAIAAFTKAISINKKYSPAYAGRGVAYMNLNEYKKAIKSFNLAIKRSPKTALNYRLRGEAYSLLKDYKKAVKDFDRAIKNDPEMLEAYYARAVAYNKLKDQ